MSGGYFGWNHSWDDVEGRWQDEELDELYRDLFCGEDFSVRGYGGLFQSLDFYLSGDTDESDYRDAVQRFKEKWFHRTPRNRVEFYENKLQATCDRYKRELGLTENTMSGETDV